MARNAVGVAILVMYLLVLMMAIMIVMMTRVCMYVCVSGRGGVQVGKLMSR